MKKSLSLILSALTLASALTACAPAADQLDPAITLASSDAATCAQWLDDRLDVIPDDVVLGIGSNTAYGIDMRNFPSSRAYIARAIDGDVLLFGKTEEGLERAVREYAKAADVGATSELDTVYLEGAYIEKLTIAGRDISEFTVVFNRDREMKPVRNNSKTVGNAEYASGELIRLIKGATDVTLQAVPHTEMPDGPVIMIDYITDGSCGENGFSYKVENGNLYINGAPEANGCANGVYHFLENECGWRGLVYGDTDIQESDHIAIENGVTKTVDPMFDFYYIAVEKGIQNFINGRSAESRGYNGIVPYAFHGIDNWVARDLGLYYQICRTDESEYLNIFDTIYSYVKTKADAGQVIGEDLTTIDISAADNMNYCKCGRCLEIIKEEDKAVVGPTVRFANRLAAEMEAEGYGGLVYQIFAYHGTNKPPKTSTRDDVFVTFTTDGCCTNHPLAGGECFGMSFDMAGQFSDMLYLNNDDYAEWIHGWGEKCENLYVYHYVMPHNFGSYSYFKNLYDDMMFLKECGLKGFHVESEYNGLGFQRVYAQLMHCLIWNPEITEEEYNLLCDEILEREYGEGYGYIKDYVGILEATEAGSGNCWNCWGFANLFNAGNYDVEMFYNRSDECLAILENALKLTSTARQDRLINSLITEVLYRQCAIGYFEAYDTDDTEAIAALEEKYQLCLKTGTEAGFGYRDGLWPFCWTYYGLVVQPTIEEAAWITWEEYRDDLTFGDREQKPMPDKWVEWYETSETSSDA